MAQPTIQEGKTGLQDKNIDNELESVTRTILEDNSDEILELYYEHVPQYLAELKDAVANNDREQISYRSHKMCSAMKTIGYTAVARILERIEREQPAADQLEAMVEKVDVYVTHSLAALVRRNN